MKIHRATPQEALSGLGASRGGLSGVEALRRKVEFGENKIPRVEGEAAWRMLTRQFTHFLALLLWLGAALAFAAEALSPGEGMLSLGFAILGVIAVNGLFSFWQEYRAEKALKALEKLLPQRAAALRDGAVSLIEASEVVPGDILVVGEGDSVPADCRIIEAEGLLANLATLTGESRPRALAAEQSAEEELLHSDNILFAGTTILAGRGIAVVFATGHSTEFSKIAHLTQSAPKSPSPLQKEIALTSKRVGLWALTLGLVFFSAGQLSGLSFWANFTFAIGLIVAFVPEGLLPTVTLSLALACRRMAARNALVRHMPAVEALGCATVICTDKTGTLTQNRMEVKVAVAGDELSSPEKMDRASAEVKLLLAAAGACNDLKEGAGGALLGDPMEVALVNLAGGLPRFKRLGSIPFEAKRRRMSVACETPDGVYLFAKGAPEAILPLCAAKISGGVEKPLDEAGKKRISEQNSEIAQKGLRVIAFAVKKMEASTPRESWESGLSFVGLAGLEDPPRTEVPAAVEKCRAAGIRVIMVTGDQPLTALAIARQVGIVHSPSPVVVTGEGLRRMSGAELQLSLDAPEIIFARLTADQKLRIVSALKKKKEIVAVTGDGVNDAPALKYADVGIAMGISGTEVARESADVVLLDDNFASIVAAVEEGRAVFGNIRKFLRYILTSNVPEAISFLAFTVFGVPLPLTIIQILAIDLGTNLLPALALGAERGAPDVMEKPPRPRGERLLRPELMAHAYFFLGPMEAFAALWAFFYVLHAGGWSYGETLSPASPLYLSATTATLAATVMTQVANLYLCRAGSRPLYASKFAANPLVNLGALSEIVIILALVYTPLGWLIFRTAPFGWRVWAVIIPFMAAMIFLEEARKLVFGSIKRSKLL